MVKAELSYNPYLLETKVRFNGQAPRINSLVEKYDQSMLQTWIKQIPEIFYNEMNGYDFELESSGPKRDYMELVQAFADAGVNTKDREQVYLFYKNELGGRYTKLTLMNQLLEWLEQNPNLLQTYVSLQQVCCFVGNCLVNKKKSLTHKTYIRYNNA